MMDHFFRAISIFAGRVGLENNEMIRARSQVRPGKVQTDCCIWFSFPALSMVGWLQLLQGWVVGCIQHLVWYGLLSPIVIIANCLIISKTFFTPLTDNFVGRSFIENMANISNVFSQTNCRKIIKFNRVTQTELSELS